MGAVRQRCREILKVGGADPWSDEFDWFIMGLITLNITAVILGTVGWIQTQYQGILYGIELVSVGVFSVEYLARLWSATAEAEFAHPVWGRVRFALQPFLVIDLLAILPFFLGAFLLDLRVLRALRLFRFFRLFKLARYSSTMREFTNVLTDKKEDLVLTVSATSILLVIASSMMYFVEHDAQPEAFSSIPESFWWGVVTLTTVGYGDIYPITPAGRFFGAVIAFLGVGLFALPASILASGFVEEDEKDNQPYEYCPHCGEKLE